MEGIRVAQRCIKNLNYNAENSIMEIHIGDRVAEIELVSKEDNKVVLTIDGKPFEADVVMAENASNGSIRGEECRIFPGTFGENGPV